MDLTNANEQPPKKTASWIKKLLIILLVLAALAGFAGVALFCLPQSAGLLESLRSNFFKMQETLPEAPTRLLTRKKKISLTFQGTMVGEKGAIAIINDKMVAVGADIEGIRVDEIRGRILTLEHNGEKFPLSIGQTFSTTID